MSQEQEKEAIGVPEPIELEPIIGPPVTSPVPAGPAPASEQKEPAPEQKSVSSVTVFKVEYDTALQKLSS